MAASMKKMRLFLGIELPANIKAHIAQAVGPIKTSLKGWENEDDYHLTILFIGEASLEDCENIQSRMKKISFTPFELHLGGTFRFFNRRILYLDFHPSIELESLKDKVENEFSEWLKPNRKPFIAHITIKRWQRYEYDELKRGIEENRIESKSFEVKALALFKSEKDSRGQKYHVIYDTGMQASP